MKEVIKFIDNQIAIKWLDEIPLGFTWVNESGKIIYCSKAFYENRGYTREEASDLTVMDVNPLMSLKRWKGYWKRVVKEGKITKAKSEHITKDGIVFPIEAQSSFIEVSGKKLLFTVITPTLEKYKFKNLLEVTSSNSKMVGWEWDRISDQYSYTSYLMKLCDIQQVDNKELGFINILKKLLDKNQLEEFNNALDKTKKDAEPFELDFSINKNMQADFWIKCTAQPLVIDDEVIKIYGTIQDISQHRDFSDEMYLVKFIMDNMTDQVFWSDDNGKFMYANIAACNSLGYSTSELYGMYVWETVSLSKDEWFAHWRKLKEVREVRMEHIQKSKEGKSIPVLTTKYALKFNEQYYNVAIVKDVSQQKRKEAQLQISLEKINELQNNLSLENTYLKEEILEEYSFKNIISKSEKYKKILSLIQDVSHTDATVLILGESGTGKELLARAVHELSGRADKSLIKVNCAALPENLIESELFGHEKGAFTGAYMQKMGRFELADKGTIFLDEIGELPLDLQSKLLRVLQEGEFERVGSVLTKKVDVRIIAATNRNLIQQVKDGKFREDLFFRLNVFPIVNLPLRERKEDIPLLAQHFMEKFAEKMNKPLEGISPSSIKRLMKYNYQGNVRELENIIERGVITSKGNILQLPPSLFINKLANDDEIEDEGLVTFDEMQKKYITKVLEHTNWKVTGEGGAAEILGMNGKTLYSRMTKLGISK